MNRTFDHTIEFEQVISISRRVQAASQQLFANQPLATNILHACQEFESQCGDILLGRGVPGLTIAVIGAKGQGKTWITRQLVLDELVRGQLPSGILSHEATRYLYWIGAFAPASIDSATERYLHCPASSMLDLGIPYTLLDTPGMTDADLQAAAIAKASFSLAPVQLLVIRRDQLRGATTSPLASRSEGVLCIPIITSLSPREFDFPKGLAPHREGGVGEAGGLLKQDIERWIAMLRESAPRTNVLEPILIEDFEATGDEPAASRRLAGELRRRLQGQSMETVQRTVSHRLSAAELRLRHRIRQMLDEQAPHLAAAVARLLAEVQLLPKRAVESMLGSTVVLETALRARLRAQIVADTSPLWFPYRTTLSCLSLTQGAWDRLLLAMTGSLPSLFGTLVAWTKNVQQSRKLEFDIQQGLRERLNGQMHDQFGPIQKQFQLALSLIQPATGDESKHRSPPSIRLNGIDELQNRSIQLFERMLNRHRPSRFRLTLLAMFGALLFWLLLAGPIVSTYREYLVACYHALVSGQATVEEFPHPSPAFLLTSALLSFIPMLLYAMFAMTNLLRRSTIESLASQLHHEHLVMIEALQNEGILQLEFDDPQLLHAQFLLSLEASTR